MYKFSFFSRRKIVKTFTALAEDNVWDISLQPGTDGNVFASFSVYECVVRICDVRCSSKGFAQFLLLSNVHCTLNYSLTQVLQFRRRFGEIVFIVPLFLPSSLLIWLWLVMTRKSSTSGILPGDFLKFYSFQETYKFINEFCAGHFIVSLTWQ